MKSPVRGLFAAALFTLPWIGFGVVKRLTGIDTGAGWQPAYLLLGTASAILLLTRRTAEVLEAQGRAWRRIWACILAVVLLSSLGMALAPGISAPIASAIARVLKQGVQLFVMMSIAVVAVWQLRGPGAWRLLVRMLALGVLFQAAYGILQAIHFYHPLALVGWLETVFTSNPAILSGSEELYLGGHFIGIPRLRGTACEPLYLGNYLLLALPLLLREALRDRRYFLPLACGLMLMLGTWSRGAWLALVAGAAAWLWAMRAAGRLRFSGRSVLVTIASGAVVVLLLAALAPDWLGLPLARLHQSLDRGDWSNLTRLYSMQAAWRAFLLSPVVGVGWGQFAFHFHDLVDPRGLQSQFTWPVVNNYPLLVLCETGTAGFALLAASIGWLVHRARRATLRIAGDGDATRLAAAIAAAVGVSVQLMTFSQYNLPHIWVTLAVLIVAVDGDGRSRKRRDADRPLVLLDAMAVTDRPTGVGNAALDLIRALADRSRGCDFLVACRAPERFAFLRDRPGWRLWTHPRPEFGWRDRWRWPTADLPRLAYSEGADLVHALTFPASWRLPCPQVLTVHDIAFRRYPRTIEPHRYLWYRYALPRSLASADLVLTNSADTERTLWTSYPVARGRTRTVHFGAPDWLDTASRGDLQPDAPFLFVGTIEPRKNISGILAAHAALRERWVAEAWDGAPPDLQLIGAPGWRCGELVREIEAAIARGGVTWHDYRPRDELAAAYAGARALVYPSLHEGFGFPILEAMRAGCPVITSDRGATREVAGSAAMLVDPDDVGSITDAMIAIRRRPALAARLVESGRRRVLAFSWESAATGTFDAYSSLCPGLSRN